MTRSVGVRVLGGVEVVRDDEAVAGRSRKLRTLLAMLAVDPGRGTSPEHLVGALWSEESEPRNPGGALQIMMVRLRTWLDPDADRMQYVRATGGAYVLHLDRDAVDLRRFLALADHALAPATGAREAVDLAAEALGLWRGEPFAGCLEVDRLVVARVHAEERRRRLVVRHLDALLELDRPHDAVEAALPEVRREPDREALVARAMTALHRAARSSEAVALYRSFRAHLLEEHGEEPGEGLQALVERVLARPSRRVAGTAGRTIAGRDDTVRRIVDALSGPGRMVLVEGEAGIGKTVLLQACADAADRAGARTGVGAWDVGAAPMAAWHEATATLPGSVPVGPPGPAVHTHLSRVVASRPLLLALDDAHRADSGSLGVLTALVRLGPPDGLVVLVGARTHDVVAHPEWDATVTELVRSPQVERMVLGQLTRGAVDEMVTARFPTTAVADREPLADVLWQRAAGHPLHTSALLEVMAAQPDATRAVDAASTVPERLRPLLSGQVAGLPADCRRAVEALATLQPVDLDGLAAVLERPPLELAAGLRPALDSGVVLAVEGGFVVRHELVADAAREALPEVVRAHLHAALHRRLAAGPPVDVFARLRHAEGAGALVAPADLARVRLDAGVAAYRDRALTEALALLDAAAPALDDEHTLSLLVHRGRCLSALGRYDEADDVLDVAVERASWAAAEPSTETAEAARLATLAAIGDEWLGMSATGDPRRLERLQHVEKLALPTPARFELLAALFREEALGGTDRPDVLAEIVELAAVLGDDDPVLRARVRALEVRSLLEASVPVLDRLARAEDGYALARPTEDAMLRLDATEQLVTATLAVGDVARARALTAEMGREAARWHRPRHIWAAALVEAALLLAEGWTDEAETAALTGMRRGGEVGVTDAAQAYGVHLLVRHLLGGTLPEVGDLAARAAEAAPAIPAWSAGAALVDAAAGRRDAAREHLAEFHRRRRANTSRSFDRPALCMAAGAAFLLDDAPTAALVRRDLPADPDAVVHVGFGAALLGPATLWTGLAALTVDDRAAAADDLTAAHDLVGRLGWTPWIVAISRLHDEAGRAPGAPRRLPFAASGGAGTPADPPELPAGPIGGQ